MPAANDVKATGPKHASPAEIADRLHTKADKALNRAII
jgi:hypothetical protein